MEKRVEGTETTMYFYFLLQQCHYSYNTLDYKLLMCGKGVALVATNGEFN